MSQFDDDERALSRALHGRVDHLAESPLGLGDVQAKARVVRRRRRIAAGAAVAAAVVVIVPTGIVATRGLDSSPDPGPATATASNAPDPSATEATDEPDLPAETQPFDLSDVEVGDAPKIDWADGNDVHRFDGTVVSDTLPDATTAFAPMADGWVALTRDDEGNQYARLVPLEGMVSQVLYDASGALATSPLGEVVAWATPEGAVDGFHHGGEPFEMQPIPRNGYKSAVAVTTEDCQEGGTEPGGCTVFVNTDGEAWFTSSHGIVERADEDMRTLTAWSQDRYAGITEVKDDLTTCSVVKDNASRDVLWETCDNRLMDFSPTGATVLGVNTIGDGDGGEGVVSLMDAATGRMLVDLQATGEHQTYAYQYTWEDDSHVLLVVRSGDQWSIVRLGTDGSMEYAVEPRKGPVDFNVPFLLRTLS